MSPNPAGTHLAFNQAEAILAAFRIALAYNMGVISEDEAEDRLNQLRHQVTTSRDDVVIHSPEFDARVRRKVDEVTASPRDVGAAPELAMGYGSHSDEVTALAEHGECTEIPDDITMLRNYVKALETEIEKQDKQIDTLIDKLDTAEDAFHLAQIDRDDAQASVEDWRNAAQNAENQLSDIRFTLGGPGRPA